MMDSKKRGRIRMALISIPFLMGKCNKFVTDNHQLKISKCVSRGGSFVFYREYTNYPSKIKHESADFRISLVSDEKGNEGWAVSYFRHTGKWSDLPIFGDFDYCLKEIKSGDWAVLMPM